jgi:hypothetical protein
MDALTQIRDSTNMGLALGGDRFKYEIEQQTGRRVHSLKRGPKPKIKGKVSDVFLL